MGKHSTCAFTSCRAQKRSISRIWARPPMSLRSMVRSPVTSNVDLHVGYGHRLSAQVLVEAFVNVFNLFDQQDELNVDENYTFDSALPIVGGDASDLKHAKAVEFNAAGKPVTVNRTLTKNQNFDHTNAIGVPRSFQLGLRLSF